GLAGCRRADHRILPYTAKPPEMVPGNPLYYATTFVLGGRAMGVLAETHQGRPTKLEGNPLHPASGGALNAFAQASILDLYDPDRSGQILHNGEPATWEELAAVLGGLNGKKGVAILTEDHASPAIDMLLDRVPNLVWFVYEPLDAFTTQAKQDVRYDLSKAEVIVSLDCDFLGLEDDGVRYKREFTARRTAGSMCRLYVVEPHLTVTGMAADHRLRVRSSEVGDYALALSSILRGPGSDTDNEWARTVARDVHRAKGKAVILVGRRQPWFIHTVAASSGRWTHRERVNYASRIQDLAAWMESGGVSDLLILGGDPVLNAPANLDFGELLGKVPNTIHLSGYVNETSANCAWHLPQAHYLESWGDALSGDTVSPIQPMIEPLFGGRTALEILARVAGQDTTDPYEIVRESFRTLTGEESFEERWRRFLNEGAAAVKVTTGLRGYKPPPREEPMKPSRYEICFSGGYGVYDGRFANNGWLQECPDPVTKLTWDNAAVLSPTTAQELDVETGDMLSITVEGRTVEIPAFVLPGEADGSIKLTIGYGRKASGSLGRHAGFDVHSLRAADFIGAEVRKIEGRYPLATTQEHWSISEHETVDGVLKERAIVREGTLGEFEKDPEFAQHMGMHLPEARDIHTSPPLEGEHQWGMTIDLSRCTGCSACVVACQAENSIPIVGKDEVLRGREMHWMRIDRYFTGDDPYGDVGVANQPMLCQHCEQAPCEPVCPVNATVHDSEGLNVMAYNRCIGTRYCSNNCPYKVRRFNYYDFNKETLRENEAPFDGNDEPSPFSGLSKPQAFQPPMAELVKMQKNPDVTVRMRGVMEKCTYCVQRIQQAKIERKVEAGQSKADKVADGSLLTACQQTCPGEAIVFGDLSDPESRVSQLRKDPRNY
ncbi:MAG: 4Fe-4S dicluster domain-containing protein, partial [Planctomycetota bacterium]